MNDAMTPERRAVKLHNGEGVLSKDLIWCECGRGISLTGKWRYCPHCGGPIDEQSYEAACDLAIQNGALLYRNMDQDKEIRAAEARAKEAEDKAGGVRLVL